MNMAAMDIYLLLCARVDIAAFIINILTLFIQKYSELLFGSSSSGAPHSHYSLYILNVKHKQVYEWASAILKSEYYYRTVYVRWSFFLCGANNCVGWVVYDFALCVYILFEMAKKTLNNFGTVRKFYLIIYVCQEYIYSL